MKSQLKPADRSGARVAVIVGPQELEAGTVTVRPLRGGLAGGGPGDARRERRPSGERAPATPGRCRWPVPTCWRPCAPDRQVMTGDGTTLYRREGNQGGDPMTSDATSLRTHLCGRVGLEDVGRQSG